MKKLFTLLSLALLSLGASAQTSLDTDPTLPITFDGSWSQNFLIAKTDVRAGDKIIFLATESPVDGWEYGAQIIPKSNSDWSNLGSALVPADGEATFEITAEYAAKINAGGGLRVQGIAVTVTAVQYVEGLTYETTGRTISMDEYGNILASEFDGLSDNAKVVFTIEATGEAVNDDDVSVIGWGIGSITSINTTEDAVVKVADLSLQKIGTNEYSFLVSELKAALEAPKDTWNRQGLYWNVWNTGKAVCTRGTVTAYEVAGTTGISQVQGATAEGRRFTLSGQQVGTSYRGLVIVDGRKVMQR